MTNEADSAAVQERSPHHVEDHAFKLYVSTTSPISSRAIVNARRLLEDLLPGRHRLSVLYIAENIEAARADQVLASPTLLRISPLPQRRFIGDLSDGSRLRLALGLPGAGDR